MSTTTPAPGDGKEKRNSVYYIAVRWLLLGPFVLPGFFLMWLCDDKKCIQRVWKDMNQ